MTPPAVEEGLLEEDLAGLKGPDEQYGHQPHPAREERELRSFVNYSEVYATLFGCLVSESSNRNLSLDEDFWVPYLYTKFQSQTENISSPEWAPLHGDPNGTVLIPRSSDGFVGADLAYYWQGVVSEEVVNGILTHCLSVTSILTTPRPYLLVWWQQFLWTLVFGVMMAMAVGGNTLVMWIILGELGRGRAPGVVLDRPGMRRARRQLVQARA